MRSLKLVKKKPSQNFFNITNFTVPEWQSDRINTSGLPDHLLRVPNQRFYVFYHCWHRQETTQGPLEWPEKFILPLFGQICLVL